MAGKLKNLERARKQAAQKNAASDNAWFSKQPAVVQRLLLEMSGQNDKGQRFGAMATIQAVSDESRRQLEYGHNPVVARLSAFCERVGKEYEVMIQEVIAGKDKKETA